VSRRRGWRRRRLSEGLVAFGAVGLILLTGAAALLLSSLQAVADAATGLEAQRVQAIQMLDPTAASLRRAATSARNASSSLADSAQAARSAAALTDQLATAFDGLASLRDLVVLGVHPFAGMGGSFGDAASQSRSLSAQLITTADSMDQDVVDSGAVADDLDRLADQLSELRAGLGPARDGAATPPSGVSPGVAVNAARIILLGLLAWLAVPAVASLVLGIRWWVKGRRLA
jgi:hypothetical protein